MCPYDPMVLIERRTHQQISGHRGITAVEDDADVLGPHLTNATSFFKCLSFPKANLYSGCHTHVSIPLFNIHPACCFLQCPRTSRCLLLVSTSVCKTLLPTVSSNHRNCSIIPNVLTIHPDSTGLRQAACPSKALVIACPVSCQ